MSERVPAGGPFKSAVGLHEALNVEHLREAKRLLSTYCMEPGDYCESYLERLMRISRLVASSRLEDLKGDEDYAGVDQEIIRLYSRIIEFYSSYIAGVVSTFGEHVIVKAKSTFEVGRALYIRGEIVKLPLDKAAPLYVAGLVEPVKSAAVTLK